VVGTLIFNSEVPGRVPARSHDVKQGCQLALGGVWKVEGTGYSYALLKK